MCLERLTMKRFAQYLALAFALAAVMWAAGGVLCGVLADGEGGEEQKAEASVSKSYAGSDFSAAFILSGRTGETALSSSNILSTPAQVFAQRRTTGGERGSLARTLADHIGSTVKECRFGLLDFKHIIHSSHSFLLIIGVLII